MVFKNKVAYCYITFPYIGEVDFKKSLNLPIIYEPVLDETLNTANITLSDLRRQEYPGIDVNKRFEPFSKVRIGFEGQKTEIVMLISHDDCKLKRRDNENYKSWTHTIQLVEETKKLERESVDCLTFTNPLEHNFADGSWNINGTEQKDGNFNIATKVTTTITHHLQSVNYAGNLYIPSFSELNGFYYTDKGNIVGGGNFTVWPVAWFIFLYKKDDYIARTFTRSEADRDPSGATITRKGNTDEDNTGFNVNLGEGAYLIEYVFSVQQQTGMADNNGVPIQMDEPTYIGLYCKTYEFALVDKKTSSTKNTMKSVLDRLLNLTPTRLASESNRYKFNAEQLAEFADEEAPEFAFTGHTMFEASLLVAGYKGSFPELNDDTISFRPLWNGIWLSASDLPEPLDEVNSSDINQYCTSLESEVQNLVGINNSREATVIEPYAGGYKTTRSGGGSEISEDTAIIPTDYNMYQSIALDMGKTNGVDIGDISPYVYEEGEYNGLSDTSGTYPNSKAYALKWAQMNKNFTELAHRINRGSDLANAFERPVIANIVNVKTGESLDGPLLKYLKNLVGIKGNGSFADLMFKSSYIPIFNARIKQYKDYFGDFHYDGSIKYNQTAELVDSEMLGEHLKQLLRKIGNATIMRVYKFNKVDDVPERGTVVDGYSVYDIKMSIRENEVYATIFFVKYAELSQYIGIKNAWKDSDISITKCYNRAISYNEFLLLTHDGNKQSTSKTLSTDALNGLKTFTAAAPLTCVQATGYTSDGNAISTVLLPIIPLAIGNSLFFQWGYQDNYSAGNMSEEAPSGATNVISGTKYNRAQKAVIYTDMLGRLDSLSYYLMLDGPSSDNEDTMSAIAHSLPKFPEIDDWSWSGEHLISVEKLQIEKDSSEALTIASQFHYCTDNENFIVGSGLTNFCSLIGGAAKSIGLYGFNERINIFHRRFSVAGAAKLTTPTFTVNTEKRLIEISLPSAVNNYNAWALMGEDSNGNYQIIFGENRKLDGSAFETGLFLLPMRKLEDFI